MLDISAKLDQCLGLPITSNFLLEYSFEYPSYR